MEDLHRNMAIEEVLSERKRQVTKWGKQDHHPLLWLAILGEEVGEANQATLNLLNVQGDDNEEMKLVWELQEEVVQVAAVAIAFLESLYSGEWMFGDISNGNFG